MSVLVAHSHDALVPRKRTSSFSFPLRPSKAPRLGLGSQSMGGAPSPRSAAATSLRRTESYASLTELLLEAVSTPSPSPPSPSAAKQPPAPPKGKDISIPYTRTLQYQQDQRLARRRKAHGAPSPSLSSLRRSDTLILPDLSTPVAVAAHSLKEPLPTPAPAPQRIARVRSKGKTASSSSAKGNGNENGKQKEKERKKKGVPANQQRQPTPPSHYRLSLSLSSPSSSPISPSSPHPKRRPTPQLILPSPTSAHAIPLLLTPRTTSPLRPSLPPQPVPGRPVFPRSKKDVGGGCQLRKIACVRRMEGTERGRAVKAMGVRGAEEVWRATVELEAMVGSGEGGSERGKQGGGEGDEMDVDAEGDTDEELECDVDPFEEVEIDGPARKEGQGVKLGSEWVVVPGEDWEMVDCAVA